jgi:N-acetylglucosamine kinase-like BadF-type ATPase
MRYFMGVDGGGTKTTATVIDDDLHTCGTATTGASNERSVGGAEASDHIAMAVRDALDQAGLQLEDIACICMCLSGFDTELDLHVPERAIRTLRFSGKIIVENDVVGAWAGATNAGAGVVTIAGTGATALGMNQHGDFWRTDGWDYVLGDSGSAYAIGLAGLRLAMKMLDGRLEPTLLLDRLHEAFGVHDGVGMRRIADSPQFGKREIAGFARQVSLAAEAGDQLARTLLSRAGEELAENVIAIVSILGMQHDEFPVCTVGGIFESVPWVTAPFQRAVRAVAPGALFTQPAHSPDVGAAILGRLRLDTGDAGSWTLGKGQRLIRRSRQVHELPALSHAQARLFTADS